MTINELQAWTSLVEEVKALRKETKELRDLIEEWKTSPEEKLEEWWEEKEEQRKQREWEEYMGDDM